jgi:hypothetical protein
MPSSARTWALLVMPAQPTYASEVEMEPVRYISIVHCTGFLARARVVAPARGAVGAFRRSAAVAIERAPGSASARESRRRESRKAWFHSIPSTLCPSGAAGKKEKKKNKTMSAGAVAPCCCGPQGHLAWKSPSPSVSRELLRNQFRLRRPM